MGDWDNGCSNAFLFLQMIFEKASRAGAYTQSTDRETDTEIDCISH